MSLNKFLTDMFRFAADVVPQISMQNTKMTMNPYTFAANVVVGVPSAVVNRTIIKTETACAIMEYMSESQKAEFEAIKTLSELREELEERITAILSDYTQMINQASVVSTLTLGMATAAFGSLLGNTDGQPEWKSTMFSISCVVTVCFSILSVIESFFLGVHINQVEARFAGGVYPHINSDNLRKFEPEELKNLNAKFNFVVVTFFSSFLSFSTTVLSTMYIGLGLSNHPFVEDNRVVIGGDLPVNHTDYAFDTRYGVAAKMSDIEPNYVSSATIMTTVVGLTYFIILFRFFESYSNHIYGKSLLRFLVLCGCMKPAGTDEDQDLLTPIEAAAERFNLLQEHIGRRCERWIVSSLNLLAMVSKIASGELSFFKQAKLPRGFSVDMRVPDKDDQHWFRKVVSIVSSWSNVIFDTLEDATLTSTDIWTQAPKLKKAYACKHHISKLNTNISVIQKYQSSERAEPLNQLTYNMQSYSRFVAFAVLIWGISGGVVVTILACVFGFVLIMIINMCTCCSGNCKRCGFEQWKYDSARGARVLTSCHFKWLYGIYKRQIQITRPPTSIRERRQSNFGQQDKAVDAYIDNPNLRSTYAGKDYSSIHF